MVPHQKKVNWNSDHSHTWRVFPKSLLQRQSENPYWYWFTNSFKSIDFTHTLYSVGDRVFWENQERAAPTAIAEPQDVPDHLRQRIQTKVSGGWSYFLTFIIQPLLAFSYRNSRLTSAVSLSLDLYCLYFLACSRTYLSFLHPQYKAFPLWSLQNSIVPCMFTELNMKMCLIYKVIPQTSSEHCS